MRPKPRITRYIGLSTDTKPNADYGDTFREMDTGTVFMFDGETWHALSTEHEYSGDIVSFKARKVVPMQSVVVTMEPIQDLHGYDHPWPAGGGKNLLDINNIVVGNTTNWSVDVNGDTLTVTHKTAYTTGTPTFAFNQPSGTYVVSIGSINITGQVSLYVNGSWAKTINNGDTFTIDAANTNEIKFSAQESQATIITKIQIESGSTATSYAPYSNLCPISGRTGLSVFVGPTADQADATTYAVDWESEAGTVYGGTLDVVSGELVVDRAMVDLGTLNFSYDSSGKRWQIIISDIYNYPSRNGNLVAEKYVADITASAGSEGKMFTVGKGLYIYSVDGTTPPSGNLVYPLATPITYHITPQEVRTLLGANNVWSDAGDVTVNVKL